MVAKVCYHKKNEFLGLALAIISLAELQQQRLQLGTKNSKNNEGRQEKNGGVKVRDRSAEELDRDW